MRFFSRHLNIFRRVGPAVLALVAIMAGSLIQGNVLNVSAAVQVLLVSHTAIPFGTVFPGEELSETYSVTLDTSKDLATYTTELVPAAGLADLCPFLEVKSIDDPAESDVFAGSELTRPGDEV